MSTARPTLAAENRSVLGKAVSRIRRDGRLPAVVFGHGLASTSISVDAHEFDLLRRRIGSNALIDLSIDGKKAHPVLVHGVQVHRVTQRPLHADLFLVRMTEELTVDVQLIPTGESEAVKTGGGTLLHQVEHLRIKALPDHLPQSISYDLSVLATFDDVIHVRDLVIPADVTLLTDPDEIVAKVAAPRVEEVVVAAEAPAVAEAEAAPAEGAAGA
jgi:large subunit ribosomal protein L25